MSCPRQLGGRRDAQQRSKIHQILRTPDVVARENLQGNQMSRHGDAHRQVRQQLDRLSLGDDLGLDSRRSEQQVDNRCLGLT
jgi:hypothetical protein